MLDEKWFLLGPKVPKLVGRIQRNKQQYHNVGTESNIAATAAICDVVIRMMEYYVDYVYGLTRALTETHVWFNPCRNDLDFAALINNKLH